MLNPELYSRQFEDSACTFINISYTPGVARLVGGKQKLFKIYSSLCANFPCVKASNATHDLGFSLFCSEGNSSPTAVATSFEAWTEMQSFRRCFATIELRLFEANNSQREASETNSDEESSGSGNLPNSLLDTKSKMDDKPLFVLWIDVGSDIPPVQESGKGDSSQLADLQTSKAVFYLQKGLYENKQLLRDWFLSVTELLRERKGMIEDVLENPQGTFESYMTLLKSLTPLTVEKEAKQQIGVTIQHGKEKLRGRCLKKLADLLLQMNNLKFAADLFKKASENLQVAKDWTWYAASLEGCITCNYILNLPSTRLTSFYDRVHAHQTGLLFSEDKLELTGQMKQLLEHEKTIMNCYDKSSETKFMLREFKYKFLLVKFSYGILKSKHDGVILDENFRLFPELRDKSSPKKARARDLSTFSTDGDVRKCLAAVKLMVFKEQTRKAAYILNELVGGDVSLDYFRENPLSAIIYLVHILPVYGINIDEVFVHRAMQRGKYFWRELQFHIVELILYYLELLQQDPEVSDKALIVTTWFQCFKLNTYYQMLSQNDVEDLLKSLNLELLKQILPDSKITLNVLEFPAVVFSNIPLLRSVNVLRPCEKQLHLHPQTLDSSNDSSLFEFQSSQLVKQQRKRYTWPASSSVVVQLLFSNALKSSENMTLQVDLVTSGVPVHVDKRLVRISPMSVESVSFEVGLKEPGEVTIEGYSILWEEMKYSSTVMFNQNSKFITRHLFNIPYLECFWYQTGHQSSGSNVQHPLERSKEFITKDFLLNQTLFYGTKKKVTVYLQALKDIESFELSTISKYAEMFAVQQDKNTLTNGEVFPVEFQFDASSVSLDKTGLYVPSEFRSFVKLVIQGLTIPFFTLQMQVLPSVMLESVSFLPANKPENFNVCMSIRNSMDVDVNLHVERYNEEIKPTAVKRIIVLLKKVDPSEFGFSVNDLEVDSKNVPLYKKSILMKLLQKLNLNWTPSDESETACPASVYIPEKLFSNYVEDPCAYLFFDYIVPVKISTESNGEIEKGVIDFDSGAVMSLEICCDLQSLVRNDQCSFLFRVEISSLCGSRPSNEVADENDYQLKLPIVLGSSEDMVQLNSDDEESISQWRKTVRILASLPGGFRLQFLFGAKFKSKEFILNVKQTNYQVELEDVNFWSDTEEDFINN